MSKALTSQSVFIPPPIDGLNMIAGPADYKLSEARILDNYRVYDFGIRQVAAPTKNWGPGSTGPSMMFRYLQSGTTTERMLVAYDNKIYRWADPTDASGTDITGAAVITTDLWFPCYHNKHIFLFNGTDAPLVHDLGTGNVAATGLTGPTIANLVQACSYNHRLYAVDQLTTSFWYTATDAITGAMTEYDLGTVFTQPGFLSFVFTWTTNQGETNQEFLVAVSSSGEILIYSGDDPEAPNWFLMARSQIPDLYFPTNNQPYCRLGTDVVISTVRGLVPLSSIVAGLSPANSLYTLSRKIKDSVLSSKNAVTDRNAPFLYAPNNVASPVGDIYCLNYERGAWSRIAHGSLTTNSTISCMEVFGGYLMVGTGGTDKALWRYPLASGQASSALTYKWATPFFDHGSHNKKRLNRLRVLGRNYGNSGSVLNTASCSADLEDAASPATDTQTRTVSADSDVIQELRPPGNGFRLSYYFSRAGSDSVNELNEIRGLQVFFEDGGVM